MHWYERELYGGFMAWQWHAAEHKKLRALLSGVVNRWSNLALSAAWNTWREQTLQAKDLLKNMAGALNRCCTAKSCHCQSCIIIND